MPYCPSVLGFAPAIEIIGRTSGKIFNTRYAVFTKGDEHLVRHTWNVLESGFRQMWFPRGVMMRLLAVNLARNPPAAGRQAYAVPDLALVGKVGRLNAVGDAVSIS